MSRTCLRNKFWELNVIEHTEHEKKPWSPPAEGVIAVVGRIKVRVDGPAGVIANDLADGFANDLGASILPARLVLRDCLRPRACLLFSRTGTKVAGGP